MESKNLFRVLAAGMALALAEGSLAGQEKGKGEGLAEAVRVGKEYAHQAGMMGVEVGQAESFTVILPESLKKIMPKVVVAVDSYHGAALKGVGSKASNFWPKRPVLVAFLEKAQFASYVRRVEKRSFDSSERGSVVVGDEQPAIGLLLDNPMRSGSGHPGLEVQVGEVVARAVFQRAAGAKNQLPAWLAEAFGKATSFQAHNQSMRGYLGEVRRNAQLFAKTQKEAPWDPTIQGSKALAAQAGFAYWIAYGPRAGKMAILVKQFTPGENQERVEMADAMQKAQLDGSDLAGIWQGWVAGWR